MCAAATVSDTTTSDSQLVSRQPQHKSSTCEVYYCSDLRHIFTTVDGSPMPLAIKMMKSKGSRVSSAKPQKPFTLNERVTRQQTGNAKFSRAKKCL